MSDQLGPWMIDPKNKDTRYVVVDTLYGEMRVIGGVRESSGVENVYLDAAALTFLIALIDLNAEETDKNATGVRHPSEVAAGLKIVQLREVLEEAWSDDVLRI